MLTLLLLKTMSGRFRNRVSSQQAIRHTQDRLDGGLFSTWRDEQIPRTSAGKFLKKALREQFRDYLLKASPGHWHSS
jgi:acyl-CoA synthetase (AMP-forming)/AMP-acid ligase II